LADQSSLSVATDRELLDLMQDSGCLLLLIGFESFAKENLDQIGKWWNYKLGDPGKLVRQIGIYDTFSLRTRSRPRGKVSGNLGLCPAAQVLLCGLQPSAAFPLRPGIPKSFVQRSSFDGKMAAKEDYKYGDIPYKPLNMEPLELKECCAAARRRFYRPFSVVRRGLASF
jgi:hypothetical protein